jgi:hypothetical protein
MPGKCRLVTVYSDGRRETLCVGIESKEKANQLANAIAEAGNLEVIAEIDERGVPPVRPPARKRMFIPPQR